MYQLDFRPRAKKGLKQAPKEYQMKLNSTLDNLVRGKTKELDISKLGGTKQGYRIRIGAWRILFSWFKAEKRVEVVDIFRKKGEKDYRKRLKKIM